MREVSLDDLLRPFKGPEAWSAPIAAQAELNIYVHCVRRADANFRKLDMHRGVGSVALPEQILCEPVDLGYKREVDGKLVVVPIRTQHSEAEEPVYGARVYRCSDNLDDFHRHVHDSTRVQALGAIMLDPISRQSDLNHRDYAESQVLAWMAGAAVEANQP